MRPCLPAPTTAIAFRTRTISDQADFRLTSFSGDVDTSTWASCLTAVAAYEDVAPAVSRAVTQAEAEISLSPTLADFIELRFVSLGVRPSRGEDGSGALEALIAGLTQPTRGAPENYLGALIVDDGADDLQALLEVCANGLDLAELHVELSGVAVVGRRSKPVVEASGVPAELEVGARLEGRLASTVVEFCENLVEVCAAGGRRAMTLEELARYHSSEPETLMERSAPAYDQTPPNEVGQTADGSRHGISGRDSATADQADPAHSETSRLGSQGVSADDQTGDIVEASDSNGDGSQPDRAENGAFGRASDHLSVYLAVAGDTASEWGRLRSIALELDKFLGEELKKDSSLEAVMKPFGGRHSPGIHAVPAGQLRRRMLGRPDAMADFAELLLAIESALGAPAPRAASGARRRTRSALVLLSAEPPLADVIASEVYRRLSQRLKLIWVVVGDPHLLSEEYRSRSVVLRDGPAIIERVVGELLSTGNSPGLG